MANIIKWSFEKGWNHAQPGRVQNGWHWGTHPVEGDPPGDQGLKIPLGWFCRYADETVENPFYDGETFSKFAKPEFDMKYKPEMPADEAFLFLDGDWNLKPFKPNHAWRGEYLRRQVLPLGWHQFSVQLFPDLYQWVGHKEWITKEAAYIYFSVNWQITDLIEVKAGEWQTFTHDFQIVDEARTVFGLGMMCHRAWDNAGFFADAWQLEKLKDPETFDKRVYLLPQSVTKAEWDIASDRAYDENVTFTRSAHDTFLKDKSVKTLEVDVYEVERVGGSEELLEEWVEERYPPVPPINYIKFVEDPEPPPDDPPPTVGYIGFHQLQTQPEGMVDFMGMGPPIFKAVNRIDQIIAAYRMTPPWAREYVNYVFRRFHPDEGSFRYEVEKAPWWIEYSAGDLANELKEAGVPTERVLVLGLNEVWEHNLENNHHTIRFDLAALPALYNFNRRENTHFRYAGSSMATGNPMRPDEGGGEEQWSRILPLAIEMANFDYGACPFTYHNYGLCIANNPLALIEYGPWLQHRWMYYYEWLKAHGAAVPFFLGEGGHVQGSVSTSANIVSMIHASGALDRYTVPLPGRQVIVLNKRKMPVISSTSSVGSQMWLNPGHGWRGLISPARAVQELVDQFDEPTRIFDQKHGYKATIGMTPFQWGDDGDWFYFNYNEITSDLQYRLEEKYSAL